MRDLVLTIFQIFPFIMNFIAIVAGIILYFVLKGQRVKRHAIYRKDTK